MLFCAYPQIESCSNNVTKYNALITGFQLAEEMGTKYLEVFDDSKLVINQMKGVLKSVMETWCHITKWLLS